MSTRCISSQQLIDYLDGHVKQDKRRDITFHLSQCVSCRRNLTRLKAIDQFLRLESQDKNMEKSAKMIDQKCITDSELYDYLEGRFTNKKARAAEAHLNSCYTCYENFVSLVHNSRTEPTPDEARAIAAMRNITAEQQIEKIIAMVQDEFPQKPKRAPQLTLIVETWWKKIKLIFEESFFADKRWRLATAFACVLLVIGLFGYPQYRMWRSDVLTGKAISFFTQEYFITKVDSPRPVGGFRFDAIGDLRSLDELKKTLPIKKNLVRALKLNPDNALTHQRLGTYYLLIENDMEQANHHYQIAYRIDPTNAAILNDLGVLALYQKNDDRAISCFLEALQSNPKLREAQYNLAIAYSRTGKISEAKQELEKYQALDPAVSWYEIGKKSIDNSKRE